jgi:hypothetical protein
MIEPSEVFPIYSSFSLPVYVQDQLLISQISADGELISLYLDHLLV